MTNKNICYYPSLDVIISFHNFLCDQYHNNNNVRDKNLLESAYYTPLQSFFGEELYPNTLSKIVRLSWGIASNHPFIDGNKRVACMAMLTSLTANGYDLEVEQYTLYDWYATISSGSMTFDEFYEIIKRNIRKIYTFC